VSLLVAGVAVLLFLFEFRRRPRVEGSPKRLKGEDEKE